MSQCLLKIIVMPSIAEKCEGCGETDKSKVKDLEVRNGTRQVARAFLCDDCRPVLAKQIREVK